MEWHVNAREWDGGKAALKLDVAFSLLLRLSLGMAFFEDLTEHLFNLFFSHLCHELAKK